MPLDCQLSPISHAGDRPLEIAVIGSGIAGMSAAWLLSHRHKVTMFEREARPGGHSNTAIIDLDGRQTPVDTGFIVYNDTNYPNLVALFDHLQVPTKPSDMSFAVSIDRGDLEYSTGHLRGLLGQPSNMARPRYRRMITDILRFYRRAPLDLSRGRLENLTIGQYLAAGRYEDGFIEDHLMPMAAAIWSSPLTEMRTHSAASIVRFFQTHGLLNLTGRPRWRTVDGGSREYIRRLTARYQDRIRVNHGVRRIVRQDRGVWIEDATGVALYFDHVVIATHADTALALLGDPSRLELNLLGAIRYQDNPTILHQDASFMPRRRSHWSSWNYLRDNATNFQSGVSVTYWMNRLQGIDPAHPLFVTLNPPRELAEGKLLARFSYRHPLLDTRAAWAQSRLWRLQGHRNTWFCGAYFGAGFHEDGLQAGLAVAEQLGGVSRPWRVADQSGRIALQPALQDAAE